MTLEAFLFYLDLDFRSVCGLFVNYIVSCNFENESSIKQSPFYATRLDNSRFQHLGFVSSKPNLASKLVWDYCFSLDHWGYDLDFR